MSAAVNYVVDDGVASLAGSGVRAYADSPSNFHTAA